MSESVKMPALGESVTEGTVTSWLKQVGDTVEVDEPLVEVATDKVDTEVPSPFAGVLEEILVEEDETVEVGAVLAKIGDGDGAGSADKDEEPAEDEEPEEEPAEEDEPAEDEEPEEKPAKDEKPAKKSSGGSEGEAVTMPALGESVTEGTVTSWLKSVGDTVEVDDPLLEVATDKVDTEVPSPFAGTLQKIVVEEDETVEVGAVLAYIGDGEAPADDADDEPAEDEKPEEKESAGAPAEAAAQQEEPEEDEEPTTPEPDKGEATKSDEPEKSEKKDEKPAEDSGSQDPTAPKSGESGSYVTPLVRKLAADKGVDLSTVTGTGVGGRIRKQDVLEAAEKAEKQAQESAAPAAAPAEAAPSAAPSKPTTVEPASDKRGTREKMSRLRQVIARRMTESLQESAQLTTVLEVDMTRIANLRARAKNSFHEQNGVKLTFLPFFVKAATEALRAHPKLNASIEDKEIVYHGAEHVGIAVDTERGLLVPVIKDAGDLNITGIAKRIADLAARTRENKVGPDELGGSTFTITNTGSGGALFDTPIINQPEVAIMGTGTIVRRPAVVQDVDGNETIAIRSMCYLSISYDHRLVDGADASRFLSAVKRRLEEGAFESEVGL